MKRLIALILAAIMLTLCGCSSEDSSDSIKNNDADTSSKKKDTIFTEPQSVNRVTFALPPGTSAAPAGEDKSGWIFIYGNVNFIAAYFIGVYDLKTLADKDFMGAGDYEFLTIGDTEAMHFDYMQGEMYMSAVTFNHLGCNYVLSSSSYISAEKAHEYYDELVETIELQPVSYNPRYPTTNTNTVTTARPSDTIIDNESRPTVSFSSFSYTGTGSKVIRDVSLPPVVCVVQAEHSGRSNFAVWHHTASGRRSLLVNEIGDVSSCQAYNATRNGAADGGMLEITADGSWKITFIPLTDYVDDRERSSFSGRGDSVVGCFTANGVTVCRATHSGNSNFAVQVYEYSEDGSYSLAFNEIGQYSGETVLRTKAGKKYFFNVTADGYWTLDLDV